MRSVTIPDAVDKVVVDTTVPNKPSNEVCTSTSDTHPWLEILVDIERLQSFECRVWQRYPLDSKRLKRHGDTSLLGHTHHLQSTANSSGPIDGQNERSLYRRYMI